MGGDTKFDVYNSNTLIIFWPTSVKIITILLGYTNIYASLASGSTKLSDRLKLNATNLFSK